VAAAEYESPEVHVCKGVYTESALSITTDVVLLGGFDCASWSRTHSYGFPDFDGVNETVIQNADGHLQGATLRLAGSLSQAAAVDGFTILGTPTATSASFAVYVTDTAAPVISNDQINGGAGSGGSVGVDLEGEAASLLEADAINGGTGTGRGAVGVLANTSGAATLTRDLIVGGQGTPSASTGDGAVGLVIETSLANPVTACQLYGTATTCGNYPYSSAGVAVTGGAVSVTISGSEISGGSGIMPGVSAGVSVSTGGDVTLTADRIYGGSRSGCGADLGEVAIDVEQVGRLDVENSMIHGGTGSPAYGVAIGKTTVPPSIVFDTIYSGSAPSSVAILLGSQVNRALLADDFVLGAGPQSVALDLPGCSAPTQLGLLADVIVANSTLAVCATDGGAPSGVAVLGGMSPSSFFSAWSSDDGVGTLFTTSAYGGRSATGWTLTTSASLPCELVRGGEPFAGVTADINGVTRSSTAPSIGAQEYEGSCTGPSTP
jgi:hypothetical protein